MPMVAPGLFESRVPTRNSAMKIQRLALIGVFTGLSVSRIPQEGTVGSSPLFESEPEFSSSSQSNTVGIAESSADLYNSIQMPGVSQGQTSSSDDSIYKKVKDSRPVQDSSAQIPVSKQADAPPGDIQQLQLGQGSKKPVASLPIYTPAARALAIISDILGKSVSKNKLGDVASSATVQSPGVDMTTATEIKGDQYLGNTLGNQKASSLDKAEMDGADSTEAPSKKDEPILQNHHPFQSGGSTFEIDSGSDTRGSGIRPSQIPTVPTGAYADSLATPRAIAQNSGSLKKTSLESYNKTSYIPPTTKTNSETPGIQPQTPIYKAVVSSYPSIASVSQNSMRNNRSPMTLADSKPEASPALGHKDFSSLLRLAFMSNMAQVAKPTPASSYSPTKPLSAETSKFISEPSPSSIQPTPTETSLAYVAPTSTQASTTADFSITPSESVIPTETPDPIPQDSIMGFEECASYQRLCRETLCRGAEEVETMDCNGGGTCKCKPSGNPSKSFGNMNESGSVAPHDSRVRSFNTSLLPNRANSTIPFSSDALYLHTSLFIPVVFYLLTPLEFV